MGLLKDAKISGKKLVELLEGEAPFFHMSDISNLENLERHGALSALDAKSRGLLKNIETPGAGMDRVTGSRLMDVLDEPITYIPAPHKGGKGVVLPVGKNLRQAAGYSKFWSKEMPKLMAHPDPRVSAFMQRVIVHSPTDARPIAGLKIPEVAGKNWGTISFAQEPMQHYGDVGIMTSRKKMRGRLAGGRPTRVVDGVRFPPEFSLQPRPHYGRTPEGEAFVRNLETATAEGTILYDPRKVDRATAKRLKAKGAIPLNARLRRKVKGLLKAEKLVQPRVLRSSGPMIDELSEGVLGAFDGPGGAEDVLKRVYEGARVSSKRPVSTPVSPRGKVPLPAPTPTPKPKVKTPNVRPAPTRMPARGDWWSRLSRKQKGLGALGLLGLAGAGALGTYLYNRPQGEAV